MPGSLRRPLSLAGLALLSLAACASAPEAAPDAEPESIADPAALPADAETRAAADRAPPLERANFWAGEHAKDPADVEVTLRFGEALRVIGSHDRVVEITTQALVIHPKEARLHLLKGRGHLGLGEPELAVNAFSRAAENDPMNATAYASLGLALDRVGQHRRAQTAYARALEIEPERTVTRSNYGLSLALSGDLDAAETQLRAAAGAPDATSTVRQNLALVLGLQGDFDAMTQVANDAPDDIVDSNVRVLKALRGDGPADAAAEDAGTEEVASETGGLGLRGPLDASGAG